MIISNGIVNGSFRVIGNLQCSNIIGNITGDLTGTAAKAIQDSSGQQINTTYIKALSVSGQTLTYTKGNGTTGKITTQDTKNTAGSTNSSSKLYLIGATSQASNPQTYSRSTCYIGTDGSLYSAGQKVSIEGHSHTYLPLSGGTVSGQVILSKTTDISAAVATDGALVIGNKTGKHLAVGNNRIIAKASSTTADTLSLNYDGGLVYVGGGGIRSAGEIQSITPNAFRAIAGNYGFIVRNDGSNTYFLLTNSGDQYGTFNNLRPFYISNSTGKVYIQSRNPLLVTSWSNGVLNITY